MKKVIKLTESDLHKLVKESVTRILNENINEGNLWNNIKGGIQGAYNGYTANKGKNDLSNKINQNNSDMNPNTTILGLLQELYQAVGIAVQNGNDKKNNKTQRAKLLRTNLMNIKNIISVIEKKLPQEPSRDDF
jgi:hypothetical protein